jgi:hypothetical protein
VTGLLHVIAQRFTRSQFVQEMASEKYTKGFWKWLIFLESSAWDINVSFVSGVNNFSAIESYGNGFKVIGNVNRNVVQIITVSKNAV